MKSTISDILLKAKNAGVKLALDGDSLKVKSKNKAIHPDLLQLIRGQKQEIVRHLKKYASITLSKDNPPREAISPRNQHDRDRLPLSFGQERLWFVHQLEGSVQYHMPIVLQMKGILDEDRLSAAFKGIVERHSVLRTTYHVENGIPYQVVQPSTAWSMEKTPYTPGMDLDFLISTCIDRPFDLSENFMLRIHLIQKNVREHLMVVVIHHIAADGWSEKILLQELIENYKVGITERPAALPELPIEYADYSVWQRTYFEKEKLATSLSFWEKKLEDVAPIGLPLDYPRPSVQSTNGDLLEVVLDGPLSQSIKQLCQAQGATLYMTLLAAYKVLLYKYTDQSDICVGSAINDRSQEEVKDLIGFFINNLALRTSVDSSETFTDFLSKVKEVVLEAFEHRSAPFEQIVNRVLKKRDASRSPVFQVMMNESNLPDFGEVDLPQLQLSSYPKKHNTSKVDLTFNIQETKAGIRIVCEYCTDLFSKETAQRMLTHYQRLLRKITVDPSIRLCELSILTDKESHELLEVFNTTSVDYPRDTTVIDLFLEQVHRYPEATALTFEKKSLSYKDLDTRSNQLAHYLIAKGVFEEEPVGIFIERSMEMVVGILAILKAGGAYLPIDPEYPSARIDYMLSDAGVKRVLTNEACSTAIPDSIALERILLDGHWDIISAYSTMLPEPKSRATGLAYVIYTSGSTGRPKGVMIEHAALLNRILWAQDHYGLEATTDTVLQKTNFCFDVSVWEFFWPLAVGCRLVLAAPDGHKDPNYLKELIVSESVTTLHFVPSMLMTFLQSIEKETAPNRLSRVLCSGESLPLAHVRYFRSIFPRVRLDNLYGPTEAAIDVTSWTVPTEVEALSRILIGKPVSNTHIYILNDEMALQPIGVVGELCIGGRQLARGYLNQEELTHTKFVADPFAQGERMYRTGDLARWLPDGTIEFLGRKDHQVKIRGYRIELGEIESRITEIPQIHSCCVLAPEGMDGNRQLVGYLVTDGDFDNHEVQEVLREQLPEYMVPRLWVSLESMPLTASGKTDRDQLPPVESSQLASVAYVAPQNELEEQLTGIWQELLGIEKVGVRDNFFELGGHSLLATRLVSMVRKSLGVEMAIRDVFVYETIADLSMHLSGKGEEVPVPALSTYDRPEKVPLSFSQERLWFLDQLQGSSEYLVPVVLHLSGDLDIEVLSRSLREIVRRHEALRTIIISEDGVGYQRLLSADGWNLEQEESVLEDGTLQSAALSDYLSRPFDLSRDYMFRACLYHLGEGKHALAWVFHHIAFDGLSERIFIDEFSECYRSGIAGTSPVLPQLPYQYMDYALWQREYLEGEVMEKQLDYWEQRLKDAAPLVLPTDYARPPIQSTAGATISYNMEGDLREKVVSLSRKEGVTVFMTLLAAFKVLLGRYSGQEDISVGTPVANRTQEGLEHLIGFFINTLVLRSQVLPSMDFLGFLSEVRSTTVAAYDHQQAPFEKVVERVAAPRDRSRSPLFQVLFSSQNTPEVQGLGLEGATLSSDETKDRATSKFDITVNVREIATGFSIVVEYCTDLFAEATIMRMLSSYQALLDSIVADPTRPLCELPMLTAQDKYRLLNVFNKPLIASGSENTVLQLFAAQVRSAPDSRAIVADGSELSYAELDEQSDRVAHHLNRTFSIGKDSLVGLMVERSHWSVVAILGILKSGAGYLPIDISYPEERKTFMIEDSGIGLLIVESISLMEVIGYGVNVFSIDVECEDLPAAQDFNPTYDPRAKAYVIYTSGSTGRPKGVVVTHGNLWNYVAHCAVAYSSEENTSFGFPLCTSLSFDLTQTSLFLTLCTGGTLSVYREEIIDTLPRILSDPLVNALKLTPSHLLLFQDRVVPPHLRCIIVGGEPLQSSHLSWLDAENGQTLEIYNEYGPTEATIGCTWFHLPLDGTPLSSSIPIGRPFRNVTAHILDASGGLLPIGVVGELCIGGHQVAAGYLGRPELTRERFVMDPFWKGGMLYRTGDLARWLPDGQLEFMGRNDEQVKIRGYRIELGEIETALAALDDIGQSCVMAPQGPDGYRHLVAYVVAVDGFDSATLEERLSVFLPEYMIPRVWVPLTSMPLTENGKIDRKSLPSPETAVSSGGHYEAPSNELEECLIGIWQDLLARDNIGIKDDFFELGGHSLLATRVVSLIRKELNIEVAIQDIFTHTNISDLGAYLSTQVQGTSLPVISAQVRPEKVPLSFSQERLWFIDRLQGSVEYHIPFAIKLMGDLDKEMMQSSLQEIVSRHATLRTIIVEEEGVGYQKLLPSEDWVMEHTELGLGDDLSTSLLGTFLSRPFHLDRDYMFRACLYDLGNKSYVLAGVFHHIASDGWSERILVQEFMELYRSHCVGTAPALPELPLDYMDYALWQREHLEGQLLEQQLSYWEERLKGVSPLQLPTDFVRPSIQGTSGSSVSLQLEASLSDDLKTLGQKEGATAFMILLAGFKVLLCRYSGQEDISVGSPIANRTQEEMEHLIGFFVNTLVLRDQLDVSSSFLDLLSDIRSTTLEAYDHQSAPFEKVVERVSDTRDMSRSPLFQVLFVLQNTPDVPKIELEGLTLSNYEGAEGHFTSQFDLTLNVEETAEGFSLILEYCTDLFTESTVSRMLSHYRELLRGIVAHPTMALRDFPMLAKGEEHQLLEVFNGTTVACPDTTIIDLFAAQVDKAPESTALVFEGREMSYRELDEKSNQFARYLHEEGAGPQDRVAICLDRSLEMIIVVLGTLKSGAAYVPIDSEYPKQRIDHIIDDSAASFFVTTRAYGFLTSDKAGLRAIVLEDCKEIIDSRPTGSINKISDKEQAAYIIYTSGSTGLPKGVEVGHHSLLNIALCWESSYQLGSDTCLLQMASFSFDVFTGDLCRSLLFGGKMILCPSDTRLDPEKLYALIADTKVTLLEGTPGLLVPLMDYIHEQNLEYDSIKLLILGSDICGIHDFKRLYGRFGHAIRIINSYGTTEATIDSAYFEAEDIDCLDGSVNVPIGKPLWNTYFYVLDPSGKLLPMGIPGELYIGGHGVAKGYLNGKEPTHAKFMDNPFREGERMYRTGDLVRWLPDGNMEFLGRRDSQVKVRGYRIELGEIESRITEVPGVLGCCVLAPEGAEGYRHLVAYLVTEENTDSSMVQEALLKCLPNYMVPRQWVPLSVMPLTKNGKIDKKALPSHQVSLQSSGEYLAPRNETETQLVEIWQGLLGRDGIGIHDNFFELGGHSLLATRMVSMVRKTLEVEMTIRDVFFYMTVAELGLFLSNKNKEVLLPPLSVRPRPEKVPLSFSQERLWFLDQLQGSAEYHIPIILRLSGDLDVEVLYTGLREIVRRHEVLRTVILQEEGIGYQRLLSEENWTLERENISGDSQDLRTKIDAFIARAFDLEKDYMFRSCLYDLGGKEYVLTAVFHHIASDAWSENILIREFKELYRAGLSGSTAVLPTLHLQYMDYALWQREYLIGEVMEEQLSYWEERLKNPVPLELPTDYARPPVQSTSGAMLSMDLEDSLSEKIRTLGREKGVTVFMTLLAAFKVLLSRYSGQRDISVGTPVANRTQEELEHLIGFFINTLVLRSHLDPSRSFTDFLSEIRSTTLEAYDHQHAPFEKVVERISAPRDMSRSPLFQVLFSLGNTPDKDEVMLEGLTLSSYDDREHVTAQFDLIMNVVETDGKLSLLVEYRTDLFKESTILAMLTHYQKLLHSIVATPEQQLSKLSMLTSKDVDLLLNRFNTPIGAPSSEATVLDLFAEQVRTAPDGLAIASDGLKLSYAELNEHSDRLAHYLRSERSLGEGSLIGIMMERSHWSVISILGILKSGAAYVPIDISYPESRKSFLVDDSGMDLLIIESISLMEVIGFGVEVFSIDVEYGDLPSAPDFSPLRVSDVPAYVIYTSGSTGQPKGVILSHGNLFNYIRHCSTAYASVEGLSFSFPLCTSLSFDLTQTSLFLTLCTGGVLSVYREEILDTLPRILTDPLVDSLKLTPSHLTLFNGHPRPHLRRVIIGGEALLPSHLAWLDQGSRELELYNEYGPTEATVGCTWYRVPFDLSPLPTSFPIGRPLANVTAHILDRDGELLPIGAVGELCIGGLQVAIGYLNRPELTRERFVTDPFIENGKLYRTGDLARWLPDGQLEFLGRWDHQLKVRGYRIELGEVEAALSDLDGVSECCVLAPEGPDGYPYLVGYVSTADAFDSSRIESLLGKLLPEYMVPRVWVALESMPLTINGKLDRSALPSPDSSLASGKEYVAPRNALEKRLVEIWQELLGVKKVGIQDNFFELGGHSLLATRLVSIINAELSIEISIREVFEHETIEEQTVLIEFLDPDLDNDDDRARYNETIEI